ncbi:MAG: ATP-dependent DNA helicase RecG [Myxococcaceae bacterium]|nr:ATP-dependent DNA helicase RecG [Myxococcaceae bacterium]
MSSSPHPLEPLVGPLRFAAARDFANLSTVKSLATPLAGAIARASSSLAPELLDALKAELVEIDAPDPTRRRASVSRVLAVLERAGVTPGAAPGASGRSSGSVQSPGARARDEAVGGREATAEVAPLARGGSGQRPVASHGPPGQPPGRSRAHGNDASLPSSASSHESPARPASTARTADARTPSRPGTIDSTADERPDDAEPAAPPARGKARRGAKSADPDADAPTRILSIAPQSGPLSLPVSKVGFRVNPRLLGVLKKRGIHRIGDVLFPLPRVYEDRRSLKRIAQLRGGERGTIIATVRDTEESFGRGRRFFRAILADPSGSIAATYFQTGPWLKARFPIGKRLVASGEVRQSLRGWEMPHPEIEPADDVETSPIHFNRIVPVYPGFERHEQRSLRELAFKVSEQYARSIEEPLPDALREKVGVLPLAQALRIIHFPPPETSLTALDAHQSDAHRRLAFDELFFLQLGMALKRQGVKVTPGIAFDVSGERLGAATGLLPFTMTGAQARVVQQLARDMARPEPMNRLVQGDVGSGKTAVAMVAASLAAQNGYQVAVMAPTEILAEQHFKNFSRVFEKAGIDVALVTGSGASKVKRERRERVSSGQAMIAVGTHALIEDAVEFAKLGLVVVDEQHRFGVMQRHQLMAKGVRPDVLVMTATPIPRTLAMTMYGDLDVSVIDELPPGRTPIETRVFTDKGKSRAWEAVREQLAQGHQAYVVYPLVEESEKVDLGDATQGAEQLKAVFPTARVGLLHGRMKQDEKDAVMTAFRAHQLDVLVSTTVIEVGVDVPNASVMVIEHAERFGLSQLHQLRGRVGRGAAKSYCFLIAGYARSEEGQARLEVMAETNDGFVIAERDLEIRGPGEFLGTRQSGLPELAVANLARDQDLLSLAQVEARAIVEVDPSLERPEHVRLRKALEERWEGRLKLARVG